MSVREFEAYAALITGVTVAILLPLSLFTGFIEPAVIGAGIIYLAYGIAVATYHDKSRRKGRVAYDERDFHAEARSWKNACSAGITTLGLYTLFLVFSPDATSANPALLLAVGIVLQTFIVQMTWAISTLYFLSTRSRIHAH